jgi:very-short-patch-repair endonuclease
MGIDYIPQCKLSNTKQKFDFYLPKYNLAIEINGGQHYREIDYFGGKSFFQKQKKLDNQKRQFCKKNQIELLEIPYENKKINTIRVIIESYIKYKVKK